MAHVQVDQRVADDDRAAFGGAEQVAEVGVLSAAGFGGGGLGGDARIGSPRPTVTARRPSHHQGGRTRRSAHLHADLGSDRAPAPACPISRSCRTSRVMLSIQAGLYPLKPVIVSSMPYPRHTLTTTSRGCCGLQPGHDLSAPLFAVLKIFDQAAEGAADPHVHDRAGFLGHHFQPPVPLGGDLQKRRSPHRGMRVADQGHRSCRGGITHRALGLSAFVGRAQAAVVGIVLLLAGQVVKWRGQV